MWSGILSGENITIVIKCSVTPETFTTNYQFDWELAIEDWLIDNEVENNQLTIAL